MSNETREIAIVLAAILAGAVVVAVGGFLFARVLPPRETVVTVHFDGPLVVKLLPPSAPP